jgi:hypothetical protein
VLMRGMAWRIPVRDPLLQASLFVFMASISHGPVKFLCASTGKIVKEV